MTTDTTATDTTRGLTHDEAMSLQEEELARTLRLLETLGPEDWSARTDCPDWDVHHMYLHVLGAFDASASLREQAHQMVAAMRRQRREGGPLEANLSAVQVADRAAITPGELPGRLRTVGAAGIAGRRRMPAIIRNRVSTKVDGPVVERWTLGYLADTIYLRDLWMHRVDATRATGRTFEASADHDGRIVADVVNEWARRHGSPYHLVLAGPAGGEFRGGGDEPDAPVESLSADAIEFCRVLAGRGEGTGLMGTVVPF